MSKETGIPLVVGGGGRESSLVHGYSKSPHVKRVVSVPGNDLMQDTSEKPVQIYPDLKTTDVNAILDVCKREDVDLVDVAQDNAIEVGLVDALRQKGIPVVGPTRDAGEIEWSKVFARNMGKIIGLTQPDYGVFSTMEEGVEYLLKQPVNKSWFVKADGLAEGKGVIPIEGKKEIRARIKELRDRFPDASGIYLIEDWIGKEQEPYEKGEEFSYFVITDGKIFKRLGAAQDQKRLYDNDQGPNTGGMGCTSPPFLLTQKMNSIIDDEIISRVFEYLRYIGREYKGVLYLGGIYLRNRNKIYVIEFNARWGDPEAQVVVPSLTTDLYELGIAVSDGRLRKIKVGVDGKYRIAVAGVAKGYPYNHGGVKGKEIFGIDDARKMDGVTIYGAGVAKVEGKYYVNGGRLFYVVGEGDSLIEVRGKVYEAMKRIRVEGDNLHYRTDTGLRDAGRFRNENR